MSGALVRALKPDQRELVEFFGASREAAANRLTDRIEPTDLDEAVADHYWELLTRSWQSGCFWNRIAQQLGDTTAALTSDLHTGNPQAWLRIQCRKATPLASRGGLAFLITHALVWNTNDLVGVDHGEAASIDRLFLRVVATRDSILWGGP